MKNTTDMKRFKKNLILSIMFILLAGTAQSAVSVIESHSDVACFGDSTGSINITAFNGTAPYTYLWNGGITTEDRTNLTAGTYSVTVSDNTGATTSISVTITEYSELTINLSAIAISCHSGSNGAINNSVSGGRPPYSYLWNDGAFTRNRTGLSAATYTVTITDLNGCTAVDSIFVPQPAFALTVTAIPSPLACLGGPSGSAVAHATGGTPPYSYWWGSGFIDSVRLNLVAGTYCVTATDSKGCPADACATIPAYTPLSISSTQINNVCYGDSTGSINVTVSNGTIPYSYLWNDGLTSEDLTNLEAGNYQVTATDNNACTISHTVTIQQPSFPISVNTTIGDVTCNGANDGFISISILNGNSPYTFSWSDSAITQNRIAISGGNYTVTITGSNGCSTTSSANVSEPTPLTVFASAVYANCFGDSSGAINITAFGSFAPYVYSWSDGGGDLQNRTDIPAGNYIVSLVDNHGCTASASATVSQPLAPLAVAVVTGDVTCFGGNNGWINLTSNGGTAPYTYDWGSGVVSQNRDTLSIGTYPVTITDNAGCTYYSNPVVSQPDSILITSQITDVTCIGGNDGGINLTVIGGTPGYSFDWGSGVLSQNRTNVSTGSYMVTVSDSFGCTASHTSTVSQISPLNISVAQTNVTCNGLSDGSVSTSVNGGTTPYSFVWDDGTNSPNRNSITAGIYSVTVTDANTCTAVTSVIITEPTPLIASTIVTKPACFGLSNGSVDLTVSGGTGAYLYSWSNNVFTEDLNSVAAGNYLVNVTDSNNCITSTSAIVIQPSAISLSATHTDVGCSIPNSGSIDLTVIGGTLPYAYNWSTTETTEDVSSLAIGNYSVVVSDSNFCSASAAVNIAQASALTVTETHTDVSCYNANDGSINISATGGTAPYTYNWAGNVQGVVRTNLSSGVYGVTANDNAGCSASISVSVLHPSALLVTLTQTDVACGGTATGSIDLTVAGGTTNYSYLWSDSSFNEDRSAVTAGNYSVTVTDANSCSTSIATTIVEPSAIQTSFSKTDAACFGDSNGSIDLSVSGGVTPYSFIWTNSALTEDVSNIPAGNYSVIITDANNCSAATMVTIAQPTSIQVNPFVTAVSCFGGNDGKIDLSVNGGAYSYNFVWNDSSTAEDVTLLTAGNYSVSVTDADGCSIFVSNIPVTQPAALTITPSVIPVSCNNRSDGAIDLNVVGGTLPYTYEWSNQSTNRSIDNLTVGIYSATVTDFNGCMGSVVESISITPPMILTSVPKNTACKNVQTGEIDLTLNGGTPSYIFKWSNGSNSEDIANLPEGNYLVTVTDSRDCSTQDNFTISFDYELEVNATTSASTIKAGEILQLSVTSNVDYGNTYDWSANGNSVCVFCGSPVQVTPRETTFYTVRATDINGCKAEDTITVEVNSVNDIFVPNVFTPNNDGSNDVLKLHGDMQGIVFLEFSVFNRWGEQVFESTDHNFEWDGTFKGEALPQGVYVYRIKTVFSNGYSRNHNASITILR